jgi:hypothetical protein
MRGQKNMNKICMLVAVVTTCIAAHCIAQESPSWANRIVGVWKGSQGEGNIAELTVKHSDGKIAASYWFSNKGGPKDTGTISNIEFINPNIVECTWIEQSASGKCRLFFDASFMSFSGTYGRNEEFEGSFWCGYVEDRLKKQPTADDLKQKADKFKGSTLVFKGFYLGMPINDAAILMNNYMEFPDTNMWYLYGSIESKNVPVIVNQKGDIRVKADESGNVTEFHFHRALVNKMFGVAGTPVKTFLQQFINAYDIPSLEYETQEITALGSVIGSQGFWRYSSEQGYVLKFFDKENVYDRQSAMQAAFAGAFAGGNVFSGNAEEGSMVLIKTSAVKASNFD